MEDTYLTPAELSDRLDISPARLEEMRLEIDGPAYALIDGKILYPIAAVVSFEMENMFMKEAARGNDSGPWSGFAKSKKNRKKTTKGRKRSGKPGGTKRESS